MAVDLENELLEIIYSYRKAQLFHVAAKLGISAILAEGPKSSDEIAQCTHTDPDALYRVLRALSSFGIYKENAQKHFELTAKGALLNKDAPGSVWIDAIMRMEEYNWRPWGELLYSVKTGKSAFDKIFGVNLFEYLAHNPEASQTFNEAMGVYTQNSAKAMLDNYDFSPYNVIADVGGGNGELLRQILSRHTHIRGVLFDLPTVIQKTHLDLFEPDIAPRLEVVPGSFFDAIPGNCDLYILKKIIHDWDDEHSIKILRNCFKACPQGSRILLIETVLDAQNKHYSDIAINDIHMLVQTIGGRERTQQEYYRLLSEAGFEPTTGHFDYIEGIKR